MRRCFAGLLLPLCLMCAACQGVAPAPSPEPGGTTGTAATTTTATTVTTTTAPTETYPTRTAATLPAAIEVPSDPYGYHTGMTAGAADMLYWDGTLYHAVMLATILPPAGEAAGHIAETIARDIRPATHGQCNNETLVGQAVWLGEDCLYTAPEGTRLYRQWLKGPGTCPGPVAGGWEGLRFEGHDFWQLRWFEVKEDGTLEGDFLTVAALPADKGFVWAGQILASGLSARVEYGCNFIDGLGRDLYASAAYPNILYAGSEEAGYWVLVTADIPLTCGSIRQEAGSPVLDLTTAAEADIAYLASVLHSGITDLATGTSLEMFGIEELKLPTGSAWAETFYLKP